MSENAKMKRHLLSTLFCVAIAGFTLTAHAQRSMVSGDYGDGMLIGVDPATQAVTGYFSAQTGQGQFSCIFYLTGKLGSAKIPVSTYFPGTPAEKIKGDLLLKAPDKFTLRLSTEHGGVLERAAFCR
jgi:hypothetical protein